MAATQGGGNRWQMLQMVRRGLVRAEQVVRNPKELLLLLTAAERRLDGIKAGPFTPVVGDLQTLLRMLRAYGEGEYRDVSGKNLALAAAGLLYLVSPLDMIPDFLPGGFSDDAAVIGFIVRKLRTELVAFEAWERTQAEDQGSQEGCR
ncbi:MAG TPA: DUF1232 domain-containing protein [Acidimicrobiia bacterium]|nr:DUF1232 domain-containing protein [Acidimicrobiia bacterium]